MATAIINEQVDAINSTLGELVDDLTTLAPRISLFGVGQFSVRIPLFPYQFIGNAYINAAGTTSDNNHSIATQRALVFHNKGAVHIYVDDANLYFNWRKVGDASLAPTTQEIYYDGNGGIMLNVMRYDNQPLEVSDLDNVYLMTSQVVYDDYITSNFGIYERTQRMADYADNTVFARYGMYQTAEQMGFLQRSRAYYRTSSKPMYCEKEMMIFCPNYSSQSCQLKILHDGVLHTISGGMHYTVPAKTVFGMTCESASRNNDNPMLSYVVFVVDGTYVKYANDGITPSDGISQYICGKTITRCDASCIINDKIFMISRDNEQIYSVWYNGDFVVSNAALPHTAGHANSCNYDNGYIYVSDWTNNQLIHVFEVDYDNNSLSYVKDITLPSTSYGKMEYFVQNNEREIFFLGWQTGDSSVSDNNLIYGLYIKTDSGYVLSYLKKAIRPNILQGFTMQNGYIYAIECTGSNYEFTGTIRININTGEFVKFDTISGVITTTEIEGIMPVATGAFIVTSKQGQLFLVAVTGE